MKPLMSRKVTPANKDDREWEPSENQLTDDGREAFRARQRKRMADAEKAREQEKAAKVQPIHKKRTA